MRCHPAPSARPAAPSALSIPARRPAACAKGRRLQGILAMRLPCLLLVALLLALAAGPARAGTQELRLALARLIETLDAGLTRNDLRALRIEINAEIRV